VADTYDAMTSSRPYRNKVNTKEEALTEIKRCSGKQFDPDIVQVFVELMTPTESIKNRDQRMVKASA
jgi:HD-GYP domain-containing protein (c-di-GMP phosphodiesterase class II)